MVYLIYMDGNGHKLMRPVNNREEYIALRNGGRQRAYVAAVRNGVERKKSKLVQMCYSCLPNADGRLKGATRVSNTVGMDIDHVAQQDMAPLRDLILSKRQQLGLLMLELSARGRGYHLVFRRRPQLSQVENLEWAARLLMQVMPRLGLDEQELQAIVDSACKEPPKGLTRALRDILGTPANNYQPSTLNAQLDDWGAQIEALFADFPILRDICKGLKRNQYPAALIVAGAFEMTLMTRCWYRFYHRPEEQRRLNASALIIGDPASGKSFATRLFKLLAAPIVAADQTGREAINAYRELMRTKGANKEKPKKPKVVVRVHPARTSNAQFIQDMVNAVETVDGEEMHLHMLTFDTELDNTVSVQKGGSWIDKQSLELKAFHNEEDGQAYSNNDSVLQDFNVYWNYVYTGTPIALKKKVNEQNFGSGLATRLTVIPLPATNFQMLRREPTVDYESDARLKAWAERLDRVKGELSVGRIVDELYDWTARRMMDAQENDSRADEMLLKRCAYHGLNYATPFIVMRHWDHMHADGDYWCGTFETDDVDWRLAELIVNMQFACQRHYFGAMAEAYFDNKLKDASANVQRRQKTYEGFQRLPDEFTNDDVMRCFQLSTDASARSKTSRLLRDHLIEKIREERGTAKALFRKTSTLLL